MSKELIVTISEHTWLDCSKSWFIEINGKRTGGEIFSSQQAKNDAMKLAENIGGTFKDELSQSNEAINALFGL